MVSLEQQGQKYGIVVNEQFVELGLDKGSAELIIMRINDAHRPNLEVVEGKLYCCFNNHERWDDCDFELLN